MRFWTSYVCPISLETFWLEIKFDPNACFLFVLLFNLIVTCWLELSFGYEDEGRVFLQCICIHMQDFTMSSHNNIQSTHHRANLKLSNTVSCYVCTSHCFFKNWSFPRGLCSKVRYECLFCSFADTWPACLNKIVVLRQHHWQFRRKLFAVCMRFSQTWNTFWV